MPNCHICKRELDDPNDPTTRNCGGDCLRCMAEIAEDPDCILGMRRVAAEDEPPQYVVTQKTLKEAREVLGYDPMKGRSVN
jgi:hypothetical protein